jgi:hypothetical protein
MFILKVQMWVMCPGLSEFQQGQAVTPGCRILILFCGSSEALFQDKV